jgi:hypothetical protein
MDDSRGQEFKLQARLAAELGTAKSGGDHPNGR